MIPEELIKQLLDPKAAKIEASCNETGKDTVLIEGRGIDIIALSMIIIEEIIKDSNGALTVDVYCDMLKYTLNQKNKSKEQKDVELEIAKKIFESVFK